MHIKLIQKILGLLLMLFSATLIPPTLIAHLYQDGGLNAFISTMAVLFSLGLLLWYPVRHHLQELKIRDGFFIVVMFWSVLGFMGAVPFYLDPNINISLTDATFEAFSGLTTTGATVLTGLDQLPHSILWYRQQLQWMGGLGIIVLAVAILPMLGIGGMQLYKAETPGPVKDTKLAPRISETAKALWYIYLGLTLACALAYRWAGMPWFDAFAHSLSTVAIGGFSTHDASIGYFNSPQIDTIAILFMYLAGINFALHFTAWRHLSLSPYRLDPEARTYTYLLLISTLIVTTYLYLNQIYPSWEQALRYGAFQTVSLATTTGFATADFASWPAFLPIFLIILSFIGASAGSTGGGMKVIRALLIWKQGVREVKQLLHPNAILTVRLNGKGIPPKVINAVWGFFSLYVITVLTLTLILMALGLDQTTAFSATAAMINNLGPGLGQVASNFQNLSDPIKWILTFAMLLGRLEIFTLLVLFTPAFWRR